MLSVGDRVLDDILEEYLEDTTDFLVDQPGNTFDTTPACKTPDGGFGDTLDVISKNFPMALGAALAQTLASFPASRHLREVWIQQTIHDSNQSITDMDRRLPRPDAASRRWGVLGGGVRGRRGEELAC